MVRQYRLLFNWLPSLDAVEGAEEADVEEDVEFDEAGDAVPCLASVELYWYRFNLSPAPQSSVLSPGQGKLQLELSTIVLPCWSSFPQ